ncbi:hypothetical protein ZIOFF_062211 [Zingiber officinale]|uniref:Uncharacterized protein n=1 Tax=Zingiber officinale TaxID=94328 RepID=A0A8J5KEC0_ZINOF|nr:hypothetical protein ZIOFF_062211 [Zingiber officinale]
MNVNRDETENGKRVAERWTKITETKDQFNLGLSMTGAKDASDGVYPKSPVLELNLLAHLQRWMRPKHRTACGSRSALVRRASGQRTAEIPLRHEVLLVLVSILMATKSLRAVECPRAIVAREHSRGGFWRSGLGLDRSELA